MPRSITHKQQLEGVLALYKQGIIDAATLGSISSALNSDALYTPTHKASNASCSSPTSTSSQLVGEDGEYYHSSPPVGERRSDSPVTSRASSSPCREDPDGDAGSASQAHLARNPARARSEPELEDDSEPEKELVAGQTYAHSEYDKIKILRFGTPADFVNDGKAYVQYSTVKPGCKRKRVHHCNVPAQLHLHVWQRGAMSGELGSSSGTNAG